jgi:hypothetical protein
MEVKGPRRLRQGLSTLLRAGDKCRTGCSNSSKHPRSGISASRPAFSHTLAERSVVRGGVVWDTPISADQNPPNPPTCFGTWASVAADGSVLPARWLTRSPERSSYCLGSGPPQIPLKATSRGGDPSRAIGRGRRCSPGFAIRGRSVELIVLVGAPLTGFSGADPSPAGLAAGVRSSIEPPETSEGWRPSGHPNAGRCSRRRGAPTIMVARRSCFGNTSCRSSRIHRGLPD